jgi:hypothetical protein
MKDYFAFEYLVIILFSYAQFRTLINSSTIDRPECIISKLENEVLYRQGMQITFHEKIDCRFNSEPCIVPGFITTLD